MTGPAGTEVRGRGGLPESDQGVRRHFDRWARSYDRSWLNELAFLPALRVCQEEIIRWQTWRGWRPFRLLDVGCGTGRLLERLSGQPDAELLVGLDYSPAMIQRAAQKLGPLRSAKKLRLVLGDAHRLPFAEQSFDVVTCCHSFHHYPNQAQVIAGFARVLRPGGLLLIVDGFRDNVIGWVVFDVGVATIERNVHHASWSELRRLISAAGFASLRQRKLNVLAPLLVNIAIR